MALSDRKYVSITVAQAKAIDWSQVITTDWDSARWDGTSSSCLVKWEGKTPSSIAKLKGVSIKSRDAMRTEVRTPGDKYASEGNPPSKKS